MPYRCLNAVLMIIFNRPTNTMQVFREIRKVKPPRLYIVADGPRNDCDISDVVRAREIQHLVDWECQVVTIYSDINLGCKKRVITGISEVFMHEDKLIVIEDDCVPTEQFFQFMDWGLSYFEFSQYVAVVSGSNLLDYAFIDNQYRNGFSQYINCWGWGTWKRVWEKYDPFLSIQEVNKTFFPIVEDKNLSLGEKYYWLSIIRHAIYSRTVWDFYLQYFLWKNDWVSVYPSNNLVYNIGFDNSATHTQVRPFYVTSSMPVIERNYNIMKRKIKNYSPNNINCDRDKSIIRTLYGFSRWSLIKLYLGNILRYLGILK